jgi:hypothetical protein
MMRSSFLPARTSSAAAAVAYHHQKSSGTATCAALVVGRSQQELCSKRRHHHQHLLPPPPPRRTSSTVLFWSSPVAWPIYGLFVLYLVTGYTILRYGVCYLILKLVVQKSAPWMAYMANDAEARRAARYVGKLYRWLFGTTTTTTTTTITTDYKDGVKTRSGRAVKVAASSVMPPRPDKLDN